MLEKIPRNADKILVLKADEMLIYTKENEVFFMYKTRTRRINKFRENISFLIQSSFDNELFLACDGSVIKLFTVHQNIFTFKTNCTISDIKILEDNKIIFCNRDGVFLLSSVDGSAKRIKTGNVQSIEHVENIEDIVQALQKSTEKIDNLVADGTDSIESNLLYCIDDTLFIRNLQIRMNKIKRIQKYGKILIILFNHGYLEFKDKNMKYTEILNVKDFISLDRHVVPYTARQIFFSEFVSKTFASEIWTVKNNILYLRNHQKFIIDPDYSNLHLSTINRIEEDISFIFSPETSKISPQTGLGSKFIEPEQLPLQKSIRYKQPEIPIPTLISNHPLRHELNYLRDLIRTHSWREFLSHVCRKRTHKENVKRVNSIFKDEKAFKELGSSLRSSLIRAFIQHVWSKEPVKVKSFILRAHPELFASMNNDEFIFGLSLLRELGNSQKSNHSTAKKRLKRMIKNSTEMIKTLCLIDLYGNK